MLPLVIIFDVSELDPSQIKQGSCKDSPFFREENKYSEGRSIRSQSSPSPRGGVKRYRQKESIPEIGENSRKVFTN